MSDPRAVSEGRHAVAGVHPVGELRRSMSGREAVLSAAAVFVVALLIRAWAASQIPFPRPEDVAYYVGVARNLVEGRGFVTDAIWSFGTPPLEFPRPAFEVWLPLPSVLMALPMALLGTTFAVAQLASVVVGALVCVLAWRLGADVAESRSMPLGRARTLGLGAGLTAAVYLPLVLASVQPDSTMPFAAIVLLACLLITRIVRDGDTRRRNLAGLGALLGLAALTRNEAIWLALTWAIVAWSLAGGASATFLTRARRWFGLVVPVGVAALLVFAPWGVRDWFVFGSPFPGQALTNALSLEGTDIFAWHEEPTLARYLAAGPLRLLELRVIGTVHNLTQVLLLLGVPLSVVGLVGLPSVWRGARPDGLRDPLRPLLLFSVITFLVASLVFPVSTTWGTFLHAAGAIQVLLVISALLVLDAVIGWVGVRRGWTRPVAWLGVAFGIAGCLLFSAVLLPTDGATARTTEARYEAIAAALAAGGGAGVDLAAEPGPVITDFPIWFAETTRHEAIALPDEPPSSILDLAGTFDPPARLIVVDARNDGEWLSAVVAGVPGSECFVPIDLPPSPELESFLVFRIRCA